VLLMPRDRDAAEPRQQRNVVLRDGASAAGLLSRRRDRCRAVSSDR
jgi:hypothetical protein